MNTILAKKLGVASICSAVICGYLMSPPIAQAATQGSKKPLTVSAAKRIYISQECRITAANDAFGESFSTRDNSTISYAAQDAIDEVNAVSNRYRTMAWPLTIQKRWVTLERRHLNYMVGIYSNYVSLNDSVESLVLANNISTNMMSSWKSAHLQDPPFGALIRSKLHVTKAQACIANRY